MPSRATPQPLDPLPPGEVPKVHPEHEIPYQAELKRKALHLSALIAPLTIALLGKTWSLMLLLPSATLALSADVLRVRSAPFARFIDRVFGPLMRDEERPPVGGPVSINGATWVLVSSGLLVLLFPVRIAVTAFVMFMIADAAAAVVGRRFGRIHWGRSARTVEGSLAFVGTGLLVMGAFALSGYVVFWTGALGVLFGCAAEVVPKPFNDNLRVPLATAAVLFMLERFVLYMPVTLFF